MKSKKFFFRKSAILLIFTAILIFLHYINVLHPIEKIIITVLSPAQKTAYAAMAYVNRLEIVKKFRIDLLSKNIELENNYKKLLSENLELKTQINEMKSILKQFEFYQFKKYNFLQASILGKDIFQDSTFIIFDKGENDGIKKGQPVVAEDGIMIAKIIEVNAVISKAMLLVDANSHTAATLKDKEKTLGIITGEHGLGMKMELIPQDENILNDDIVITSGLEEYIPYGLIIGKVTKVNKEQNNFFQTAYIQPIISYGTLRTITILKTY